MSLLVVVDMQHHYGDAVQKVSTPCKDLVNWAIDLKVPIVFLEFENNGETIGDLLTPCEGYKFHHRVVKDEQNGSAQVLNAVNNHFKKIKNINLDKIRVCGVYTEYCIKNTAIGLCDKFPYSKIIVHYEACGHWLSSSNYVWDWTGNTPNNLFLSRQSLIINPRNDPEFNIVLEETVESIAS